MSSPAQKGMSPTGGKVVVDRGGMKACEFITRPFRYSFDKGLAVDILNGRLLGYTNFRTTSQNFKVTALGRGRCA